MSRHTLTNNGELQLMHKHVPTVCSLVRHKIVMSLQDILFYGALCLSITFPLRLPPLFAWSVTGAAQNMEHAIVSPPLLLLL
mgnify:CR=1 FL=1